LYSTARERGKQVDSRQGRVHAHGVVYSIAWERNAGFYRSKQEKTGEEGKFKRGGGTSKFYEVGKGESGVRGVTGVEKLLVGDKSPLIGN